MFLIMCNKSIEDHVKKVDKVLSKLNTAGFKVNAEKSFFTRNELKYLSFKINRGGIIPLPDEVETIKNISVCTTK